MARAAWAELRWNAGMSASSACRHSFESLTDLEISLVFTFTARELKELNARRTAALRVV
jgi:hypothetical protein